MDFDDFDFERKKCESFIDEYKHGELTTMLIVFSLMCVICSSVALGLVKVLDNVFRMYIL